MKKLLVVVLMFCFALIGCSDSGGGSSKSKCAGPVPCLTEKWGVSIDEYPYWRGSYAVFYEGDNVIVLMSDGEIFGIGAEQVIDGEKVIVGLGGEVTNCYNGTITTGAIDYDLDGLPEYWFTSISGFVRVCDKTLTIYNIVVEGEAQDNVVAKYDSMASLSASNQLSTDAPISAENVEKVKIMIRLIEQLMEE